MVHLGDFYLGGISRRLRGIRAEHVRERVQTRRHVSADFTPVDTWRANAAVVPVVPVVVPVVAGPVVRALVCRAVGEVCRELRSQS